MSQALEQQCKAAWMEQAIDIRNRAQPGDFEKFRTGYLAGSEDQQREGAAGIDRLPKSNETLVRLSVSLRKENDQLQEQVRDLESRLAAGEPVAKVCGDQPGRIGWNPSMTMLPPDGTPLYLAPPAQPAAARSKSEYKRLPAQVVDVLPPLIISDKVLSAMEQWHERARPAQPPAAPCPTMVTPQLLKQPAAQVPEWQPIETAPSVGTVLLWDGVEIDFGPYDEDSPVQPTHWMSLPAAPTHKESK